MSALHLVCRLILPPKGRRGRRRPTPLGMWTLADLDVSRPDIVPFAPDYDTNPMEQVR